jgi:hypothetical protein
MTPNPSPESLLAVFLREQPNRPHWPKFFHLAIKDPITLRVLQIMARGLFKPGDKWKLPRQFERYEDPEPSPQTLQRPALVKPGAGRCHIQRGLDFKSLAAGEKPED